MEKTSKEFSMLSNKLAENGNNLSNELNTNNVTATPSPENSHPTITRVKQIIITFIILGFVYTSTTLGCMDAMNKSDELFADSGVSITTIMASESLGSYADMNGFDAGMAREALLNVGESIASIKDDQSKARALRKLIASADRLEESEFYANLKDEAYKKNLNGLNLSLDDR